MNPPEIPQHSRWTLYALGAMVGRPLLRPRDPVAAWLLRNVPSLLPNNPDAAVLAAIRARTSMVDDMLEAIVVRAQDKGESLVLWTLGGGFDARWMRMYSTLSPAVVRFREIDEPKLIDYKVGLFPSSPYQGRWSEVGTSSAETSDWTIEQDSDTRPIVVLEGALSRLGGQGVRDLLTRIRQDAANAEVILDLAGLTIVTRRSWSARQLATLGWAVEESFEVAKRERLQTYVGREICPGMQCFRLLRLVQCEPLPIDEDDTPTLESSGDEESVDDEDTEHYMF